MPSIVVADQQTMNVTFDGTLETSAGTPPLLSEGVAFTSGHVGGQAGLFLKGSALAYPVSSAYTPAQGSVSLWVRPNWNSTDDVGEVFFWGIESDPGKENRAVLAFLGRDGRGTVYFGPDGALGGVSAPVNWRKGEWHRIVACWDKEQSCAALYVDGMRQHVIEYSGAMPSMQDRFYVGGLPCVTRWMGVSDGHEANAAIDDFCLSAHIAEPDFAKAAELAAEDAKARRRYEISRDRAKPAFEAAFDRLRETITLDRVEQERTEVSWDDLVGMGAALSQRIPIQVRGHYQPIFVHPDLSIALGIENKSLGIGFALGTPFELPDSYAVKRQLHHGYMPVVESSWDAGGCTVTQTAFAFLAEGEEIREGDELQYACVRLTVTNTSSTPMDRPLFVLAGQMGGRQNTNYQPFLASAARWMAPPLGMRLDDGAVYLADRAFLTYRTDGSMPCTLCAGLPTESAAPLMPSHLTNVLRFDVCLKPEESASLDIVVAVASELPPVDKIPRMKSVGFASALKRAERYWDRALEPGMALTTPEPRLNAIYNALILSSLQNMAKRPGRPYFEPNQVPVWRAVWPWEFVHMSIPLCALGYHRDLEPAFRFFTERQTGCGPHQESGRGPEGEVRSTFGCYSGNFLLRWMCETGAVLWGMAEKYRYSRDAVWLRENRASILAAWDWIQGERVRTRRFKDDGKRIEHYGLLPRGRVHDWNEWHHFMCFTDNYTWKGMSEIARAFEDAGLPDAKRLSQEADEYGQCILAAVQCAQFPDPGTGLLFVPNLLYYHQGERGGLWWADGPIALFGTGLLDARTDPRFDSTIRYMQGHWGLLMGMVGSMDESERPDKRNPFWYVNSPERGLFQNYLARSETEKALLFFYSTLIYGLSHDCYQTIERMHISDPNYAPFQPNASGNGRLLDMMRRIVIDDQESGVLWLFRGCPRRWFRPGESICVERVQTYFGPMAARAQTEGNRVVLRVDVPQERPLNELRVVVRHPSRKSPVTVTVNGIAARMENETVVLPAPKGRIEVVCLFEI